MLNVIVTGAHAYTFENFLARWGAAARPHLRIWWYEDIWTRRRLPGGSYIFTDLERLTDAQRKAAIDLADALMARGVHVHNHPRRTLQRYDLLKVLHQADINPFRALRLHEDLSTLRYPVFLRRENDHRGPITGLLHNRAELDAAVARFSDRRNLIAVEYCHTADADGMFRKYSVLKIGRRIVPRHIIHSRGWVEKLPDLMAEPLLQEEMEYLHANPHAEAIRPIFRLAGIDYGRIDYSLLDGRIVVWEINTNPSMTPASGVPAPKQPAMTLSSRLLVNAFIEAAADTAEGPITLRTPPSRITHPVLDLGVALRRVIGAAGPDPLIRYWRRLAWHLVP